MILMPIDIYEIVSCAKETPAQIASGRGLLLEFDFRPGLPGDLLPLFGGR